MPNHVKLLAQQCLDLAASRPQAAAIVLHPDDVAILYDALRRADAAGRWPEGFGVADDRVTARGKKLVSGRISEVGAGRPVIVVDPTRAYDYIRITPAFRRISRPAPPRRTPPIFRNVQAAVPPRPKPGTGRSGRIIE